MSWQPSTYCNAWRSEQGFPPAESRLTCCQCPHFLHHCPTDSLAAGPPFSWVEVLYALAEAIYAAHCQRQHAD